MKRLSVFLVSAFLALAPAIASAQVFGPANGQPSGFSGHVQAQGSPPVLSSCGTGPALAAGSTDWVGQVTTGTGTSCTITFATPFTAAPFCNLYLKNGVLAAFSWTTSTTAIVVTQTSAASVFGYSCVAKSGG